MLETFFAHNYNWCVALELIPSFALYRGLYEIGQYAFRAGYMEGGWGLTWPRTFDQGNGMPRIIAFHNACDSN